jgi:hypothetical protein
MSVRVIQESEQGTYPYRQDAGVERSHEREYGFATADKQNRFVAQYVELPSGVDRVETLTARPNSSTTQRYKAQEMMRMEGGSENGAERA